MKNHQPEELSKNPVQQEYLRQLIDIANNQTDDLADTCNLIEAMRNLSNQLENDLLEHFDRLDIIKQLSHAGMNRLK